MSLSDLQYMRNIVNPIKTLKIYSINRIKKFNCVVFKVIALLRVIAQHFVRSIPTQKIHCFLILLAVPAI